MTTQLQAVDAILNAFNQAWSVNSGFPIVWPDKRPAVDVMKQANPWVIVQLNHRSGNQTSLAGADGTVMWERQGSMYCEIHTKSGEGATQSYSLAELIVKAYQKKTISGVTFRGIATKEIGIRGNWFVMNVTVDFYYDEIV